MALLSRIFSPAPTIFVQIASYRDPECQWTIKDMYAKATHPERINVGICWQLELAEDQDCFVEPYPFPKQVREKKVSARESLGVCWARHEAQRLYRGEDYVLMIDSHMRFVPGWDEKMIDELKSCPSEKPLLSSYPPGYTPPHHLNPNPKPTIIRLKQETEQGDIRGDGIVLQGFPKQSMRGAFIAAGFLFASGRIIKEVPYDPHMYFNQEEISLAARFFTHGWDVYHPAIILLYHYYSNTTGVASSGKSLHWNDDRRWIALQERGRERLKHLFLHHTSQKPDVVEELENYGLGKARTLKEFETFAGLDFKHWKVLPAAKEAEFIPELAQYRTAKEAPPAAVVASQNEKPQSAPAAPSIGKFLPPFQLPDQRGILREIQLYAGRVVCLFFLPLGFTDYMNEFIEYWQEKQSDINQRDAHKIFVIQGGVDDARNLAEKIQADIAILADESGGVWTAMSAETDANRNDAFTLITDPNLKIQAHITQRNARNHLGDVLRALPTKEGVVEAPLIRRPHAPVMVIPQAINEVLRLELLKYWDSGKQYKGTLGVGSEEQVNKQGKRRTDVNIDDAALLKQLDAHLAQSVLPEIRKVSGFEVTCRERYKIGRYGAEDRGYYNTHRDTGLEELAHRRYSMSLALNDGYEGGLLVFPEYGNVHYQLPVGSAIIFPSTLLHGVSPVTSGERFVLVSFLFGQEEEVFRKKQIIERGEKYDPNDVMLKAESSNASGINLSPYYYTASAKS